MISYDFCLAWNWEHDAEFVAILVSACQVRRLTFLQITPDNICSMMEALQNNEIFFKSFLDRASESDGRFLPLVDWASKHGVYCLNARERARRASDKAAMHYELISAGLFTPHTIILPPYRENPALPLLDLAPIGEKFTIKPSHGSGGEGVVIRAITLDQIMEARRQYPADAYLLQAHIVPAKLGERAAWFRVIYCTGVIYPCWWDPVTHVYILVTSEEEDLYGLSPLRLEARIIARICGLELFSTEIARTEDGRDIVVDYINDPIDLRLKSKTADGVPDEIIRDLTSRLIDFVAAKESRKI